MVEFICGEKQNQVLGGEGKTTELIAPRTVNDQGDVIKVIVS